MAKQITFDYEGKEYTLEYTRKSIEAMERQGFVSGELEAKFATMLPKLIRGAFAAHHPSLRGDKIDEIYESFTKKSELIAALAEMYAEPLETLLSDEGKNGKWEKSW